MTYRGRICKDINVFNTFVMPGLSNLFSRYKTVVVMSEGSVFRAQAAHCNAPKKYNGSIRIIAFGQNGTTGQKKLPKTMGSYIIRLQILYCFLKQSDLSL